MNRRELLQYVAERFSVEPEYPWDKVPDGYVLRHPDNRKWFAVGLTVTYPRLGIEQDGDADILCVKCGPLLQGSYLTHPGVIPAYHMNKTHWVSLRLDGTAADEVIRELLEVSWELTRPKPRISRKETGA